MKSLLWALCAVVFVISVSFSDDSSTTPIRPSGSASVLPVNDTTFTGKIRSVSNGDSADGACPQINVKDDGGLETIFVVASDATIIGKDGNPTTLNWLSNDDKVKIIYSFNPNGTKKATSIKVLAGW
jgi:hypothetical protein